MSEIGDQNPERQKSLPSQNAVMNDNSRQQSNHTQLHIQQLGANQNYKLCGNLTARASGTILAKKIFRYV